MALKPGAGALADPYAVRGKSPFRCERTRQNVLSQAFYFACVNGKLEVADFLLSQGAEINLIVPGLDVKATVLHRIAITDAGAERVIRFLFARGADPSIRDLQYQATPAGWARHNKREAMADLLESYEQSNGAGSQSGG